MLPFIQGHDAFITENVKIKTECIQVCNSPASYPSLSKKF